MQTGITSILTFMLGASLIYNFKPGNNMTQLAYTNGNATIIPDATCINVSQSIGEIKEELLQCQANYTAVGEMKKELLEYHANSTKIQEELGHCQDNLKEIQTKFTDKYLILRQEMKDDNLILRQEMKDDNLKVKRDLKIVAGQQEITSSDSIGMSGTIMLVLVGHVVEGFVIMLVVKRWLSRQNTAQDTQQKSNNNEITEHRPSRLLKQVKQVPLERSVCIVSFYEETQKLHMDLAKSAIQVNIPVKQFLMKEPETQLMSIPRSKFILVFVDFNERNIILETPGQDLGDKKVVTVQAAKKMGADVFVVYVRDRGSTNLPDGVLYNTKLASFSRHDTLGKLTVNDRGISVYETFTDHQKSHINGIISKN